jgi:sulfatase maturation enzyme AslB (radical SAM superfamily)
MQQAGQLNLCYVCLVGGEPLDEQILDTNLRLIRDNPRLRFLVCTSGHPACEPSLAAKLSALRNLSMVVSVDGLATTHDRLRGTGSHAMATESLSRFSRLGGRPCGVSVTLRHENWEETTTSQFVRGLCSSGCHFLVFDPCFVADGAPGLTTHEYVRAVRRLMAISDQAPARIYANPLGELRGRNHRPGWMMHPLTVDYRGNVYASRRGRILGNISDRDLNAIVSSHASHAEQIERPSDTCEQNDSRQLLFAETLAALR